MIFPENNPEQEAPKSAFLPFGEAERYSLVEAAKSPTGSKRPLAHQMEGPAVDFIDYPLKVEALDNFHSRPVFQPGSKTLLQKRDWSGEYRIRTQVDTTTGTPPPLQGGDRVSRILSDRGARKIADSCAYMATIGTGFTTFITGTFDAATRAKLTTYDIKTARPLTKVQKEVTRTLDAMQKMYQRGWIDPVTGEKVPGHSLPFAYCWVVEIPENENGERNPHVHLLVDWRVDYRHFEGWRKRLEGIWGNGYFHLEKIKDPLCAGAYMAKAAGYISKANGRDDQGEVVGNRYGISKRARAPGWYTIGEYELGVMGHIIRDLYDEMNERHGALFAQRRYLNKTRDEVMQAAKRERELTGNDPLWAKKKREAIGRKLAEVRSEINQLPVRVSKYQVILKEAELPRFLGRALAMGWQPNKRPDSHWYSTFKERLYRRKWRRNALGESGLAELARVAQLKREHDEEVLSDWDTLAASDWTFLDQEGWRERFIE